MENQPIKPNCRFIDGNIATLYARGTGVLCTKNECPYGKNLGIEILGLKTYYEEKPARICRVNGIVNKETLEKIAQLG